MTPFLEVKEPSATAKQIAAWRADPLLPGMRIPLAPYRELGVGRLPRDELRAGSQSDDKHYGRLRWSDAGWTLSGPRTTALDGAPLTPGEHRLVDGAVIDGGTLAFRFREADVDALLGVAWRAGPDHVAFPCAFPRLRRFVALALDGDEPRFTGLTIDHAPNRATPEETPLVREWATAVAVETALVDGPTLRQIFDESRAQGADVDGAFLAEVCESVEGVVTSLDDVVVGFDGGVRSSSLVQTSAVPPGVRLRRVLEVMKRSVSAERAGPAALAALVRQLFPREAERHDAIHEEAPMLSCAAWRERVPA